MQLVLSRAGVVRSVGVGGTGERLAGGTFSLMYLVFLLAVGCILDNGVGLFLGTRIGSILEKVESFELSSNCSTTRWLILLRSSTWHSSTKLI